MIRFSHLNILLFFCLFQSANCLAQVPDSADIPEDYSFSFATLDIDTSGTSLFDYIYKLDGLPHIRIETDIKSLIRKKNLEEYQEASVILMNAKNEVLLDLPARVRSRGNMRKKVSLIPPIKIDFNKSELDSLGFLKIDKLKVVFPSNKNKHNQQRLFKEYFLYELYEMIDPDAIRTKLVNFCITHQGEAKYHFQGFIIENEAEYARRKEAQVLERETFKSVFLEREPFLKMTFFQYMIANTDWAIGNIHNLMLVKLPKFDKTIALPYDFDYAGVVGHDYAVPSTTLPIKDVHQRYFFPSLRVSQEEYDQTVKYFLSIEEDVYRKCESASYMDKRSIDDCKQYLKKFFNMMRSSKTATHIVKK